MLSLRWLLVGASLAITQSALNHADVSDLEKDRLRVAPGFKVERIYSVPREKQGSWVSICADGQGHLYASDQYGPIYRITFSNTLNDVAVEPLKLPIRSAHGLAWIGDHLYVVAGETMAEPAGLYRVSDTNHDGELDHVRLLRELEGSGEHGPHTVIATPSGNSLYVIAGNGTRLPELEATRVPRLWSNDSLLSPLPALMGSETRGMPYGGWICRTDLDGKRWELIAVGLRNAYGMAMDHAGELFTFDSDTEFEFNLPWYRPTRVLHAVSGADFGWRGGALKVPESAPDNLPSVIAMGLGSPTGMTFGYGAQFPLRYRNALWVADWSYGKLHALHLEKDGSSFSAEKEEILSGLPLPITALCVNPTDGAIYFTTGGRRIQSALYRLSGTVRASTNVVISVKPISNAAQLRHQLESLHGRTDSDVLTAAWPHLGSNDRWVRNAARIAVEHIPKEQWNLRALNERNTRAALTALLALARQGDTDSQTNLLNASARLKWTTLSREQKMDWLRVLYLTFARCGDASQSVRSEWANRLNPLFPTRDREIDPTLLELLVYLEAPGVAEKGFERLKGSLTHEEQIDYARSLRVLKNWPKKTRRQFFEWLATTKEWKGGGTFSLFLNRIREDSLQTAPTGLRAELRAILDAEPLTSALIPAVLALPNRNFFRHWQVDDLLILENIDWNKRDLNRGRKAFATAGCFACHMVGGEGGVLGPDLTSVSGRFTLQDLLEAIIEPSKAISDQYGSVAVTLRSGETLSGRIVNLTKNRMHLSANLYDPSDITRIDESDIDMIKASTISLMPEGLLNGLDVEEIIDLLAWLRFAPVNSEVSNRVDENPVP